MSYSEGDKAVNSLQEAVDVQVKDPKLREICQFLLADERFAEWPAAAGHHHAYDGGLAVHTHEVLTIALHIGWMYCADDEILTVSAILHDFCKIFEIERGLVDDKHPSGWHAVQDYAGQIYHVAGGYGLWTSLCTRFGYDDEKRIQAIGHCLLAHHGRKEWNSVVEPKTLEAYVLHAADMLSSQYGPDARRQG
jgi:3'-5' exoribonuclease